MSSVALGVKIHFPEESLCLHELFERRALSSPRALCCADKHRRLSFAEVRAEARLLARAIQAAGVGTGLAGVVGLLAPPSADWIVAQLAVSYAGACVLPLYTNYTGELINQLAESAVVKFALVSAELIDRLPAHLPKLSLAPGQGGWPVVDTAELPRLELHPTRPEDPAILAMTSGTSGRPKAVVVSHRSTAMCFATRWALHPFVDNEATATNVFFAWEALRAPLCGIPTFVIPDEVVIDPPKLVAWLESCKATRLVVTAQLTQNLLEFPGLDLKNGLRYVLRWYLCGEVCPARLVEAWASRVPDTARLINFYSTWECLDVAYASLGAGANSAAVGQPIPNVNIYVVNPKTGAPLPAGELGEVQVASRAMSDGYLGDPVRTADRFFPNPNHGVSGAFEVALSSEILAIYDGSEVAPLLTAYRTGDIGRILGDGSLEITGRNDSTVKIRGYKVALPYVTRTIEEMSGVSSVVVLPVLDPTSKQPVALCAYVVGDRGAPSRADCDRWAGIARERLPQYAAPAHFVGLARLPTCAGSGKLERSRLPSPVPLAPSKAAPTAGSLEGTLTRCWRSVLGVEEIGPNDNFFDLGGHSILAAKLVGSLASTFGLQLAVLDLYDNPSVASLARALRAKMSPGIGSSRALARRREPSRKRSRREGRGELAVIGIAGKFPGAPDVETFWSNLKAGVDSLSRFSREECLRAGVSEEVLSRPDYVAAGQLVDDPGSFDAAFWGIGKREAEHMDPQHRLFLQSAWRALENAGYAPRSSSSFSTGVFAACGQNGYLVHHLEGGAPLKNPLDPGRIFLTEVGNEKDYLPLRVSYQFDFGGPSVSVNSACSSGLVAVAQAAQAILSGQCDVALAGAASLTFPNAGYVFAEGLVASQDGHVRPFDSAASGTLFGDAVGCVVLKRLEDALEDRDHVWCVLKGHAITNDGRQKAGFSAPSAQAQARAIVGAQRMAGVSSGCVSYVEAHATATHVGDAIEVSGLINAFKDTSREGSTPVRESCALGSVKGNIGHANCAAGITGFIKTVLCLKHKTLVPTVHFEQLNDKIPDFEGTPFFVNTETREWTSKLPRPRIAGVSSFGVGGTNCHVILQETPAAHEKEGNEVSSAKFHVLVLSAKTERSLQQMRMRLADFLENADGASMRLGDVAFTLSNGREQMQHRGSAVASSISEAVSALRQGIAQKVSQGAACVFVFPGQGSQYLQMGRDLFENEPTFRGHVLRCCEIIDPILAREGVTNDGLRSCMHPDVGPPTAATSERFERPLPCTYIYY